MGVFFRLLFGNAFVYFMFNKDANVEKGTRTTIITVLVSLNITSVIILCFLKSPVYEDVKHEDNQDTQDTTESSPMKDLIKTWQIFTKPNTLIMSIMFFYVGKNGVTVL